MNLLRICLVPIWELLIGLCTFSVSGEKCTFRSRRIHTPVQLTELHDNSNVYIIDPQATSFHINCSSPRPVLWNIFSASVYKNLSVTFHFERLYQGTYQEIMCHTVSLEFKQIDEGLTGRYSCADTNAGEGAYDYSSIHIYGGTGKMGNLINRGKSIKMFAEDYDERIDDSFEMPIPCGLNYPFANRTVEILINKQTRAALSDFPFTSERVINGTTFEVIDDCPTVTCSDTDDCINFKSISDSIKASELLRHGMLINCFTTRNQPEDIVKFEVVKSPPIAFKPSRLNMTLNVSYDEPLSFKCKSTKPITLTTNWEHEFSQTSQYLPKIYWSYQAELKITTPSPNDFRDETEKESEFVHVKITCAFSNKTSEQVSWNYKLLKIEDFGYHFKKKNILRDVGNGRFACTSNAPNTMAAKFVPCSTFNDCQIKSRLLFVSDSRFQLSDFTVTDRYFEFRIPENVSGLVRCFGYDTDASGIVYVGLDVDQPNINRKLLSSEKRKEILFYKKNPLVMSNVSTIFEGDLVFVNCSIPLMLVVSHPVWEFIFRNKTEDIIPYRYIMSLHVKTEDEIFFMAAEIQVPTLEVIGIACVNQQFVTATPVERSRGLLVKNSKTTTDLRRESISIKVKVKPQVSNNLWTYLGVGFLGLVVLLVIIFTLIIRHIRRQQNIIHKLREEEIALFREGNSKSISDSESNNKKAQNMPYDHSYEIDLMNLNIDYNTCLGSGEFGVVYKATMGTNVSKPVAVKCAKDGASANYIRAAMSELKVMMFIKFHENVAKIIGAYTQELISHKLLVVMEFCENGDLHNYLRKHAEGFVSLVRDGKIFDNSSSPLNSESGIFSTLDVLKWASQIANGMKYISSLKIIHGDLAARNVLLDSKFNAKISDFGLSKRLYEYSNYVRKNQTPLPWRWLAMESLNFTEFSIASDVWAYGITLWELFSLGGTPYPGQQFNPEFIMMISSGFRLPLPEYATYDMYNLMLKCWREIPSERPSFLEIHSKLEPASYEYYLL